MEPFKIENLKNEPLAVQYFLGCGKIERLFIIKKIKDAIKQKRKNNEIGKKEEEKIKELRAYLKSLFKIKKTEQKVMGFTSILERYNGNKAFAYKFVEPIFENYEEEIEYQEELKEEQEPKTDEKPKEELKQEEQKPEEISEERPEEIAEENESNPQEIIIQNTIKIPQRFRVTEVSPEIAKRNNKILFILMYNALHLTDTRYTHDEELGKLYTKNESGEKIEADVDILYKICKVCRYIEKEQKAGRTPDGFPSASVVWKLNGEELDRLFRIVKDAELNNNNTLETNDRL